MPARVCPDCYPLPQAKCGSTEPHGPHVDHHTFQARTHHTYPKYCPGLSPFTCKTCKGKGIVEE